MSMEQDMFDSEIEKINRKDGGCQRRGPGGDCEHYAGLPGTSIPGAHDGPDDTVDAYGKPNGWCWSCWKDYSHQKDMEEMRRALQWCSGSSDFGQGGQAEQGWKRYVQPLLDKTSQHTWEEELPTVDVCILASEALYGFCGWLTTQEKATVMGASYNAGPSADAVSMYCKANDLQEPRERWTDNIKPPEDPASGSFDLRVGSSIPKKFGLPSRDGEFHKALIFGTLSAAQSSNPEVQELIKEANVVITLDGDIVKGSNGGVCAQTERSTWKKHSEQNLKETEQALSCLSGDFNYDDVAKAKKLLKTILEKK